MKTCPQTQEQSIYQHGLAVCDHLKELYDFLIEKRATLSGWRLPEWILTEKDLLLKCLFPWEILEKYTIYHDCGKPFCCVIDEQGHRHFPDHARVSYNTWLSVGGDVVTANLILLDMEIHTLKAAQIPVFSAKPEAITLLLTGLAEIHANAKMFGGLDSTSFKIKFRQIEKRGRGIINYIKTKNYE